MSGNRPSAPIRVVAVLTHPIQYYAAWFRWIAANCRELDLHVIYASRPTAEQQGAEFGRAFDWNVPVTDGYRFTILREPQPGDEFGAGSFWGVDVPEVADAIRDARPDVVVVFGWYSITLVRAIRAARRLRVPVLYHGDTNLQSAPDGWRGLAWIVKTRRLLRMFDGYLSVGIRSAALLRFFGIPDDRVFSCPHAVDNDRFADALVLRRSPERSEIRHSLGLPEDAFIVLTAGKLEPKKRPLDIVAALVRMAPRPHLAVAGSGPLERELRTVAGAAGVSVSMLGFVNQAEMPRVFAAADCLVLASDARETWGLVVNEALAGGLPCIVADSAGCAPDLGLEQTGGQYATAEPVDVPQLLAIAIEQVRERLAKGEDLASACAALAARHSFGVATAGLSAACQTLANRPAAQTVAFESPVEATDADAALQALADAAFDLRVLSALRGDDLHAARKPVRIIACCGSMVLVGGLERMTFEILRVLNARGAIVHCIVNWWDNSRIVREAERIGASWSTGYYLRRLTLRFEGPRQLMEMAADSLRTSAGLLRDAVAFRASHVLISDYHTAIRNAPALALLRLAGTRVVLRLGNAPDPGRRFRWIWRVGVNPFVDLFVSNSPFTDRELAAHGIAERKRTTIAHTVPTRADRSLNAGLARARAINEVEGPDLDVAGAERDPRRIIYVGQIIPEKGLSILLEAMALLVARGHDVRLDVVGRIDGWVPPEHEPYRAAVLARAQEPDLRDRVRFLGYRDDVPALLEQAGIHCCPSTPAIREGFGIVVIEAKRAGIPSVVFRSGNLPDLIRHREDGWICDDDTPAALVEGIEYFLDPRHLRLAMAAAGASSRGFSRERFEQSWNAVFADGV